MVWPLTVGVGWVLGWRGTTLWAALFAGGTILLVAMEDLCAAALLAKERMDLEGGLRLASKLLSLGPGPGAGASGGGAGAPGPRPGGDPAGPPGQVGASLPPSR